MVDRVWNGFVQKESLEESASRPASCFSLASSSSCRIRSKSG